MERIKRRNIDNPIEKVKGVVYRLYCTHPEAKDMSFIGATTLGERTRKHWISQYKSKDNKIGWAIRTFGPKYFNYEILGKAKTRFKLAYLAIEQVEKHKSVWPDGFNQTHGGNGILNLEWIIFVLDLKGKPTEELKEILKQRNLAYP